MRNIKGTLILLLTAFIWGIAFVAQTSAADNVGAFTFNAVRSIIAAGFLFILIGLRKAFSRKKTQNAIIEGEENGASQKQTLIAGLCCGSVLFFAVNFQQFGISVYPEGVAASGRSGFLTATYVVMVAVCSRFFGRRFHSSVILAIIGCMIGMYMLCLSGGVSGIYLGDILVLICAVFFTIYILVVDHFSELDTIKVSGIQFVVCGILSLIAALIFEKPNLDGILAAWLPILYAGIFSNGIAYTLQMVGQKYAEPAVASIAMSMESVFAALAGWVILNEHLSERELIGCALVFISVILAQVPAFKKSEKDLT